MKPEISNIIDVEKISKTLDIKWQNPEIEDSCSGKSEIIVFKDTYLFTLFELENDLLNVQLCVITDIPNEIQILFDYKNERGTITFREITKILYNPKLNLIIFESKHNDTYSQLRIAKSELFDLSVSNPISNYKNSWLTFMGENLGLIEYNPN